MGTGFRPLQMVATLLAVAVLFVASAQWLLASRRDDPPRPETLPAPRRFVIAALTSPPPPSDVPLPPLPPLCRANPSLSDAISEYVAAPKEGLLTWSCPPGRRCGGYGDRMKGIASAFLIAILTHRRFAIRHMEPLDLRPLLLPSPWVQWDLNPSTLANAVHLKDVPPPAGQDVIRAWPRTVTLVTNQDLVAYLFSLPAFEPALRQMGLGDHCGDLSCLFGCLFHTLFVVGPFLQRNLTEMLAAHPRFIAVQIRMGGNQVTGWSDPLRTSPFVVARTWEVAADWRADHCPECAVFLSTDSASHQRAAQKRLGSALFVVPGHIAHSDRSGPRMAAAGFPKVILDNLLIGQAVFAVISNSGFSYTAVWRTKINATVVRMNRRRTAYCIDNHTFASACASWVITPTPCLPLPPQRTIADG